MTDVWRPTLDDYLEAAAVILDTEPEEIDRLPGLSFADSALQAPFAGVGETDAYPSLLAKAAVLIDHIASGDAIQGEIQAWIKTEQAERTSVTASREVEARGVIGPALLLSW